MQGTMSHHNEPSRYQFFILGLWRQPGAHPNRPTTWRFSLEDTQTAQRSGFRSLAELEAFLQAWMAERQEGLGSGSQGLGAGD